MTRREGYKGYVFGEPVIWTLQLGTPDRWFRFDLSSRFPDFRNNDLLVQEIKKRIAIKEKG